MNRALALPRDRLSCAGQRSYSIARDDAQGLVGRLFDYLPVYRIWHELSAFRATDSHCDTHACLTRVRDDGKPGESRGRKATRLPHPQWMPRQSGRRTGLCTVVRACYNGISFAQGRGQSSPRAIDPRLTPTNRASGTTPPVTAICCRMACC